jgi:hypothetical protein
MRAHHNVVTMDKSCKSCEQTLPLNMFEVTNKIKGCMRAVCKPCYARQRSTKMKAASTRHDPSNVPKPTACDKCGKGPDDVDFKWRADTLQGAWRSTCTECYNAKGYHNDYRARERAKDEEAFKKRNADAHRDWVRRQKAQI